MANTPSPVTRRVLAAFNQAMFLAGSGRQPGGDRRMISGLLTIVSVIVLVVAFRKAWKRAKEDERREALRGNPPIRDRR